MQNLKITKNTNNSPTLKINIVLNVQNVKELKVLRISLIGVASRRRLLLLLLTRLVVDMLASVEIKLDPCLCG